jgi:methionyl-tRNA formyltransferase
MNLVLAAEESAGLQILRALSRTRHRLVAVLASRPKPDGSGGAVWNAANSLGLEVRPAHLVRDPAFAGRLRAEHVDLLLNVHSLYVINAEVLAAPRFGAFNLHPGPLPRYAGLNAVSWAIYRGETQHGVTVHKMEPEIDTGPIAYQSFFSIDESDTALSVSLKCVKQGVPLMLWLLEVAASNPRTIPLRPQDASQREYFGAEIPRGGRVSWSSPASKVLNFIRACDYLPFRSPWGHPWTRLGEQEVAIIKAHRTNFLCDAPPGTVGGSTGEGILVASQDQWILVTKLKALGRHIRAAEILKEGDQLENES